MPTASRAEHLFNNSVVHPEHPAGDAISVGIVDTILDDKSTYDERRPIVPILCKIGTI